ncbi:MAG TPA: 1-acyl-sn-glycerol-3-phosphate acyltransferase [Myxococcaceae bacterium]|nr:1-acyl-sn-glycerol-3-phosphate acyltransferase [Myxococcaceae bacterium]
MQTALAPSDASVDDALRRDFGPIGRWLARRYFTHVRFAPEAEVELRTLFERGTVVHVQRTSSWVNFLYLAWALTVRGLPPLRAVVNLRRWLVRPFRRAAQSGSCAVRFAYAQRKGGSSLVFLQSTALFRALGRPGRDDPFPDLVALARKSERPVFLVPELFVWEKWNVRLKPAWADYVFGSPEAPGFLHSVLAFFRNYRRAQFRVGEAIDLSALVRAEPETPDVVLARKVRSTLHVHLARETRTVFGPPYKPAERVIDETLRDRALRRSLQITADTSGRRFESVLRQSRRDLNNIAARLHPTVLAFATPLMNLVFRFMYDGIDVDEAGLDRAMRAAQGAPVVLCPCHKSHVDYLVLSWAMWHRGYQAPVVAAGANLSFFPLGPFLRRCGAFFLRRTFGGDKVYTATFRAYVRKLVRDGVHQEFFLEGGRSRTGKLLPPKLGLLTWEVEAILDGARDDLAFVPISIDYENVVESKSYSAELLGAEKKPEDLKALLSAPRVLARRYGRIHVTFAPPLRLREVMASRGLPEPGAVTEEQKRSLVRAIAYRILYDITRVSTVTPQALAATALLSYRGRGIAADELAARVQILRRVAEAERVPLSAVLVGATSHPGAPGPIQEALAGFAREGAVRITEARGQAVYQADEDQRVALVFYKNNLMNLVAPRALVAAAVRAGPRQDARAAVEERALFLSRLFKVEFLYRVGVPFEEIFGENVETLVREGVLVAQGDELAVAARSEASESLAFYAELLRDFLESYLLAALTLEDVAAAGTMDRRTFIRAALEVGKAEYLAGRIQAKESLSRTNIENAIAYFVDLKILQGSEKRFSLGPGARGDAERRALGEDIRRYLPAPG